jgi:hypothetical protein
MPRKARINNPGLTHHVMARTFNDLLLFKTQLIENYIWLVYLEEYMKRGYSGCNECSAISTDQCSIMMNARPEVRGARIGSWSRFRAPVPSDCQWKVGLTSPLATLLK